MASFIGSSNAVAAGWWCPIPDLDAVASDGGLLVDGRLLAHIPVVVNAALGLGRSRLLPCLRDEKRVFDSHQFLQHRIENWKRSVECCLRSTLMTFPVREFKMSVPASAVQKILSWCGHRVGLNTTSSTGPGNVFFLLFTKRSRSLSAVEFLESRFWNLLGVAGWKCPVR